MLFFCVNVWFILCFVVFEAAEERSQEEMCFPLPNRSVKAGHLGTLASPPVKTVHVAHGAMMSAAPERCRSV